LKITADEFAEVAKSLARPLRGHCVSENGVDAIMNTVAGTKEEIIHGLI
jgi:hypothetical protein